MDSPTDFPELEFADGVTATMTSISIRLTYADYLEARPCPAINADVVKQLRSRTGNGRGGVLVVPVDKSLIDLTTGDSYETRPLPRFEIIAEFQSSATTEPSASQSFLTMAWYQDSLSPLIDDAIRSRVSSIPWFPRASQGSV